MLTNSGTITNYGTIFNNGTVTVSGGTLTGNKILGTIFGILSDLNEIYTSTLTLANITLPAEYVWSTPSTTLTAGNGQTFEAIRVYNSKHEMAIGNIIVNVAKAAFITLTPPTANDINYGTTLSSSVLSGGPSGGIWTWTNEDIVPTVSNNGYQVTFTPIDMNNYDWSGVALFTANSNITVNPKPLTVTGVTAINRKYNGTTTVELIGGELIGVESNDAVGFVLGSGTVTAPDIGNYKTLATNIVLTGTDASNYMLTQLTGITVEINPKLITITGVTAINREYNGTTTVELIGGELIGVESSDAVGFVLGSGTVTAPDIGNYKTVATNIVLIGADASNYMLTQPIGITVEIKPDNTPILQNQENPVIGLIGIHATTNAIVLRNLPSNAKVEVFDLRGKLISGQSFNHVNRGSDMSISVHAKGMYIVKVSMGSEKKILRVAVR